MSTQPIFILSSGRSGTYSIYNALKDEKEIEIYHEFLFDETLRNSVSYHMGLISEKKISNFLNQSHSFSIKNSNKKIWIDSSNALPWMIKPLIKKFHNPKFIFLIRNGRKVVSSFFNKYSDIMYNKKDIDLLKKYTDKKIKYLSSEKKYWRPIPKNKKDFKKFISEDKFYRICKYWQEINQTIRKNLKHVNKKNKFFFKFEDINNRKKTEELFKFIGIKKNFPKILKSFEKPVNVRYPKNFKLTKKQQIVFKSTCSEEMKINGYKIEEYYQVKY